VFTKSTETESTPKVDILTPLELKGPLGANDGIAAYGKVEEPEATATKGREGLVAAQAGEP
jgi:hypothetical protein